MKNRLFLFLFALIPAATSFSQAGAPGQQTVSYDLVTHEKVKGKITLTDGTVHDGIVTYNEYGSRNVYYYGKDGNDKPITFEDHDLIKELIIDERGTFRPVYLSPEADKMRLAYVQFDCDSYTRYEFLQAGAGVLGTTIQGGQMKGHFDMIIHHKRLNKYYPTNKIKKIDKTITEYIDYCPEIAKKVQKKEKGFKSNLMTPAWRVLEKAIEEADKVCPKS